MTIISHKYKFIFVGNQRTASTSVEVALFRSVGPNDVFIGRPRRGLKGLNCEGTRLKRHSSIALIAELFPSEYLNYFKFCFVRNPWCRIVSWYLMRTHNGKEEKGMPLERWLHKLRLALGKRSYMIEGKVAVDFIGRYEKLQRVFNTLCKQLGVPKRKLTRENSNCRSKQTHYSSYYTPTTRDLVAEMFEGEIKMFGYTFQNLA